jgi:hypothetical protein
MRLLLTHNPAGVGADYIRAVSLGREYVEQVLAWPILAGQVLHFVDGVPSRLNAGRSLEAGAGVESPTGAGRP